MDLEVANGGAEVDGEQAGGAGMLGLDGCRVYKTGGNRSGLTGYRSKRSGPVPVWAGIEPAKIPNSNLN